MALRQVGRFQNAPVVFQMARDQPALLFAGWHKMRRFGSVICAQAGRKQGGDFVAGLLRQRGKGIGPGVKALGRCAFGKDWLHVVAAQHNASVRSVTRENSLIRLGFVQIYSRLRRDHVLWLALGGWRSRLVRGQRITW